VSHTTQAVIVGLSQIGGPTEVLAGSPAIYTYSFVLPQGATGVEVIPACQVTAQTSSSFTCEFGEVEARTASKGKLQTVAAGSTFERSLDVDRAQVLDATGPSGAVATFVATASDAVPSSPSVSCLPASESTFPIGTTTVGRSATDAAGNLASGQFTITVRDPLARIDALEG